MCLHRAWCSADMHDCAGAEGAVAPANVTSGFAETFGCGLCRGPYARELIDAWEVGPAIPPPHARTHAPHTHDRPHAYERACPLCRQQPNLLCPFLSSSMESCGGSDHCHPCALIAYMQNMQLPSLSWLDAQPIYAGSYLHRCSSTQPTCIVPA